DSRRERRLGALVAGSSAEPPLAPPTMAGFHAAMLSSVRSVPPPPRPSVTRGLLGGLGAVLTLGAAMAWLWGFTVDDALITCRVAWHLGRGLGYRFNAGG